MSSFLHFGFISERDFVKLSGKADDVNQMLQKSE